jgi:hypothetical protein
MDYFPHDTDAANDEKLEAMRAEYGNHGYAFYFILLERIYKKNGVLDVKNPAIMAAIRRSITGNSELFDKMLNTAFELMLFDKQVFDEKMLLTSPGIERRAATVNAERSRKRAYAESKKVIDVQNTGKIPEVPPKVKERKENKSNNNAIDGRFISFWNAYPSKVGKGAAEKAFKKYKPDDALLSDMLNALSTQKQSEKWQRDNGQYIPNPATWLNQKRWLDETTQQQTSSTDAWGGIPTL